MACIGSNDPDCRLKCSCCSTCFPWAAKCGVLSPLQHEQTSQFIFVGIYNHKRYYNQRQLIDATAEISLVNDPNFKYQSQRQSWLSTLYDPFQDISRLDETNKRQYPKGSKFIYEVHLSAYQSHKMEVNLFNDRLTLVHVMLTAPKHNLELSFLSGPNITHVLSSTRSAPKTLFDFNQELLPRLISSNGGISAHHRRVEVRAEGSKSLWVAIFAGVDGKVQVTAQTYNDPPAASPSAGFAFLCVFVLLCSLVVIALLYFGAQKIGQGGGTDGGGLNMRPLSDRFTNLVRSNSSVEATDPLTQGFGGQDSIDRRIEERYMHRGGIGDDGI